MSTQDTAGTAREGMMMSNETTRLRALLRESTELALRLSERVERAERERDDLAATLETRNAEHALAMARVRQLEARLMAARKATEDLPRHLGATWWGQQLRAALVEPTAEVSRG